MSDKAIRALLERRERAVAVDVQWFREEVEVATVLGHDTVSVPPKSLIALIDRLEMLELDLREARRWADQNRASIFRWRWLADERSLATLMIDYGDARWGSKKSYRVNWFDGETWVQIRGKTPEAAVDAAMQYTKEQEE